MGGGEGTVWSSVSGGGLIQLRLYSLLGVVTNSRSGAQLPSETCARCSVQGELGLQSNMYNMHPGCKVNMSKTTPLSKHYCACT